ncbi:unnamed protein product [Discula destructiva]
MGETAFSLNKLANAMPEIDIKLLPKIHVHATLQEFEEFSSVTPWFSYTVALPERPLPPLSDRPHIKTDRLLIRPFTSEDVDALWELRQFGEVQEHSKARGRADRSKEETAQSINNLLENEDDHWYFGVFLSSTGELIGECGLPSCTIMSTSISGWPEAEFVLKPQYWRQGYGTEMFRAIVDSWWDLPREWRRLQIIPYLTEGFEPGSDMPECIAFVWEAHNDAAAQFFAKMLAQLPAAADGAIEQRDMRNGREGTIVKWVGAAAYNPRPPPPKDADSDDEDYAEEPGEAE